MTSKVTIQFVGQIGIILRKMVFWKIMPGQKPGTISSKFGCKINLGMNKFGSLVTCDFMAAGDYYFIF